MSTDNDDFQLRRLDLSHREEVIQFLLGDFCYTESLNAALEITPNQLSDFLSQMIRESLESGLSWGLFHNNNKLIAVRLAEFFDRPSPSSSHDLPGQPQGKAAKIGAILEEVSKNMWLLVPVSAQRLVHISILSVDTSFTRRGIAQRMTEHGLDEARNQGATGVVSEASACNSQKLFAKLGYVVLNEVLHENHVDEEGNRIFVCRDGTDRVQLVYKPL